MEDVGKKIEAGEKAAATSDQPKGGGKNAHDGERRTNNFDRRKRKGNFADARQSYGSKAGRHDSKRHKKGDLGRGDYFRNEPDKRAKADASRLKREADGSSAYGSTFSKEEIDAEERKPKRKVAVMIGYSGTGYKGMQITPTERTIEGDLFQAFIKAGAISKANADDPKKASLVRCARTDKGVHAAGNMISLKLIVEENGIVEKINSHLSSQIRIWGIERTIGSFSCYQACDSRWYEYLIPSHAFLPPHPSSWLAKKLAELADEAGDQEGYESRQAEVKGFWEAIDKEDIQPVLNEIDEDLRWEVVKALQGEDEASAKAVKNETDEGKLLKVGKSMKEGVKGDQQEEHTEEAAIIIQPGPVAHSHDLPKDTAKAAGSVDDSAPAQTNAKEEGNADDEHEQQEDEAQFLADTRPPAPQLSPEETERQNRLRAAIRRLRLAYITSKRRYRIPKERVSRIQAALRRFVGTANYHNYTVQKSYKDPSAQRHIKSFVVNTTPILIGSGPDAEKSEWLSLKVHGQSFMMHQIRKMIGMVTLLVRSGSDLNTLSHSLGEAKYSIPKVPGLGLLLERPVFDSYNNNTAPKHERQPLLFSKYEKEMEEFKQREIYQRIFREEEERNEFGRFFNHIDNFKENYFLWASSMGLDAIKAGGGAKVLEESEDEGGKEEGE